MRSGRVLLPACRPWRPAPPSPIDLLAPHLAHAPATTTSGASSPGNAANGSHAVDSPSSQAQQPQPQHTPGLGDDSQHPHERWAGQQLALDGEELVGSCACLQYLYLADLLLVQPLLGAPAGTTRATRHGAGGPAWQPGARERLLRRWPSWAWWALRAASQHQALLDGRSAQLWARVQLLARQLVGSWLAPAVRRLDAGSSAAAALGRLPPALLAGAEPPTQEEGQQAEEGGVAGLAGSRALLACLLMELSLAHYAYGHVEPAERLLAGAGDVLGLQVQLTGACAVGGSSALTQSVVVTCWRRAGMAGGGGEAAL